MREANTKYKQGMPKYTFHSQGVHTKKDSVHSEEPFASLSAGTWMCYVRDKDGKPINNTNSLRVEGRGEVDVEVIRDGIIYKLQVAKRVKDV